MFTEKDMQVYFRQKNTVWPWKCTVIKFIYGVENMNQRTTHSVDKSLFSKSKQIHSKCTFSKRAFIIHFNFISIHFLSSVYYPIVNWDWKFLSWASNSTLIACVYVVRSFVPIHMNLMESLRKRQWQGTKKSIVHSDANMFILVGFELTSLYLYPSELTLNFIWAYNIYTFTVCEELGNEEKKNVFLFRTSNACHWFEWTERRWKCDRCQCKRVTLVKKNVTRQRKKQSLDFFSIFNW